MALLLLLDIPNLDLPPRFFVFLPAPRASGASPLWSSRRRARLAARTTSALSARLALLLRRPAVFVVVIVVVRGPGVVRVERYDRRRERVLC